MPTDPRPPCETEFSNVWGALTSSLGVSAVMQMSVAHFRRWTLLRDAAKVLPQTSPYYGEHPDVARETVLEIYRAMVTMAHAILEDTLREILRIKLKQSAPTNFLAKIPLWDPDHTPSQPKRYDVSDLAKYKGFTVNQVIERSIDTYLDRTSFSSTVVIADSLKLIQDDIDYAIPLFPTLKEMISRRHKIVHTLDRTAHEPFIPPLTEGDCNRWMAATLLLINEVNHQLYPPSQPSDEQKYQQFKTELRQLLNTSS